MTGDPRRLRNKRDRLRQLRAFCHAAQLQSFSLAAERLGVSQPTVSLHVRELELELGAVLFERGNPYVVLTAAGERFHRLASPLVKTMDDLSGFFTRGNDQNVSGNLRIAAGPGAVAFTLPGLLKRFQDEHPAVEMRVRNSSAVDALKLLSANEVDLAMGAEETERADALYCPIAFYHLTLIAPLDHPLAQRRSVSIAEAANWPFVASLARTHTWQAGMSMARRLGLELPIAVRTAGWMVIKDYVAAGLGVAIVPDLFALEDDRLSVVRLEEAGGPRSFGFFLRPNRALSPPAEALLRMAAPDFPLCGSAFALSQSA